MSFCCCCLSVCFFPEFLLIVSFCVEQGGSCAGDPIQPLMMFSCCPIPDLGKELFLAVPKARLDTGISSLGQWKRLEQNDLPVLSQPKPFHDPIIPWFLLFPHPCPLRDPLEPSRTISPLLSTTWNIFVPCSGSSEIFCALAGSCVQSSPALFLWHRSSWEVLARGHRFFYTVSGIIWSRLVKEINSLFNYWDWTLPQDGDPREHSLPVLFCIQ